MRQNVKKKDDQPLSMCMKDCSTWQESEINVKWLTLRDDRRAATLFAAELWGTGVLPHYEQYCLLSWDIVYKFTYISDERVAYIFAMKTEAARSSETSVNVYQTARRHVIIGRTSDPAVRTNINTEQADLVVML
jgi:hypothetical protein